MPLCFCGMEGMCETAILLVAAPMFIQLQRNCIPDLVLKCQLRRYDVLPYHCLLSFINISVLSYMAWDTAL